MRLFSARARRGVAALAVSVSSGIWIDAHALSEKDFLGDLPIVLSAARLVQPKYEAPAAVTVIDRAMIDAAPVLDITDLLRLVPGFQVGSWSGSEKSITSHGMADQLGRRMQVLVDGRSVYDPVFGGALWQSLPVALADVERIEVVRGPNAAAWGANAFLGAINIVTRTPGANGTGRLGAVYGSYNRRQLDLAENWAKGEHRLQLRAGGLSDDGFHDRNDAYDSGRISARYQYQLTPRDQIEVQMGLRNSTVDKGFPGDNEQPERGTRLQHQFQQFNWQRYLDDGSDVSLEIYHSYQSNKDAFDYAGLPGSFIDFGFANDRYDAELQWRTAFGPDTRVVVGGGWRLDRGEARYALDPAADTEVRQLRLFAHGEQRLGKRWLLQAGAMAEEFEDLGSFLSPRVTLNYEFRPRQSLRVGVARGYRIPALYEQYAAFGAYAIADGSPLAIVETSPDKVRAESILAYEIGLVGELQTWRTSYDLRVFRNEIRDMIATVGIDPAPSPFGPIPRYEFRNAGDADVQGVEMQLDTRPTARTNLHLTASLADASGINLRSDQSGGTTYRNLRNQVPQLGISALLRQRFSAGWSGSLAWYYLEPMTWAGEGDDQGTISRFDVKVARSLPLLGSKVRLELLVQNLFNNGYYDFQTPQTYRNGNLFDRRIYGQIVVRH